LIFQELTTLYTYQHSRPAVSVDIVLFHKNKGEFFVLLIKRAQKPFQGSYALPGGFVDLEESLDAAALRELWEETGLQNIQLTQIHTFGDPGRDPRGRVISTAYSTVIHNMDKIQPQAGSDAAEVGWFNLSELPSLAFDHALIIQIAIEKLNLIVNF
jgi:8-oxo-dGTP diphosphatase